MEAPKPYIKIVYNGKDISSEIQKSVAALTYVDNIEDADTVDIQLEDVDLLWQNNWYPEKGAILKIDFGLEGGSMIPAGEYEIDEIELLGPPDTVNIKGIAAGFKKATKRTAKSHIHEGKTLSEIVRTVARSAGLTVRGEIGDIRINRKVQHVERDFKFLRKLAHEYGYVFNIRGSEITFMKRKLLEDSQPVLIVDKTDVLGYALKDKSTETYKSAIVKFHNPATSEVVEHTETDPLHTDTDDVLRLPNTAENKAQAIEMTKAALAKANKLQQHGRITMPGNPIALAGNVMRLTGLGNLTGDFMIKSSAHMISIAEGWVCDLELYKVGYIEDLAKRKPKAGKKSSYNGPLGAGDKAPFQ